MCHGVVKMYRPRLVVDNRHRRQKWRKSAALNIAREISSKRRETRHIDCRGGRLRNIMAACMKGWRRRPGDSRAENVFERRAKCELFD